VAYIYLPEKEVIGLEAGREVRITLKADESTRFAGRIRQLAPTVDPATGNTTELLKESDSAWINIDEGMPHWLKDGSFLWASERSGWQHLYHYAPDGKLNPSATETAASSSAATSPTGTASPMPMVSTPYL